MCVYRHTPSSGQPFIRLWLWFPGHTWARFFATRSEEVCFLSGVGWRSSSMAQQRLARCGARPMTLEISGRVFNLQLSQDSGHTRRRWLRRGEHLLATADVVRSSAWDRR